MQRFILVLVLSVLLLLVDYYVFQAVFIASQTLTINAQTLIFSTFWGLSAFSLLVLASYHGLPGAWLTARLRRGMLFFLFALLMVKLVIVGFLLLDDLRRLFVGGLSLFFPIENAFGRSVWLARIGLGLSPLVLALMAYGMLHGGHAYQVRRVRLSLPDLPPAFAGLRIAQISDIHAGSFWSPRAVAKGVALLQAESPDLVCFTGDLVNNRAEEILPYQALFSSIQAPLGVYAILGNHDYGDYVSWPSMEAKGQNLRAIIEAHQAMGWDLLLNEHRVIERGGAQLALIGIENWGGKGHFTRYGKLAEAYAGTEDIACKILLSHDPSHWTAEVIPEYPDISLTLSGHTHGMQFGLETRFFRWSPVQYFYRQWAGLYHYGQQSLYVNRGFGYLGFPGRIGIRPEITLLELHRGDSPAGQAIHLE